jgi:hypothetical protein
MSLLKISNSSFVTPVSDKWLYFCKTLLEEVTEMVWLVLVLAVLECPLPSLSLHTHLQGHKLVHLGMGHQKKTSRLYFIACLFLYILEGIDLKIQRMCNTDQDRTFFCQCWSGTGLNLDLDLGYVKIYRRKNCIYL